MRVMCIDDIWNCLKGEPTGNYPKFGERYKVVETFESPWGLCYELAEYPPLPVDKVQWWLAKNFAPLEGDEAPVSDEEVEEDSFATNYFKDLMNSVETQLSNH